MSAEAGPYLCQTRALWKPAAGRQMLGPVGSEVGKEFVCGEHVVVGDGLLRAQSLDITPGPVCRTIVLFFVGSWLSADYGYSKRMTARAAGNSNY